MRKNVEDHVEPDNSNLNELPCGEHRVGGKRIIIGCILKDTWSGEFQRRLVICERQGWVKLDQHVESNARQLMMMMPYDAWVKLQIESIETANVATPLPDDEHLQRMQQPGAPSIMSVTERVVSIGDVLDNMPDDSDLDFDISPK